MKRAPVVRSLVLAILPCATALPAADWPRERQSAARTGRTTDSVAPPYRARWIWLSPRKVLRNRASNPSWPDT